MDAAQVAGFLSAPAVVFTLAAATLLVLTRSPWPWSRAGGAVLAVIVLGALVLAFRGAELRRQALDPEKLPILVLALASGVVTWAALNKASREAPKAGGEAPPAVWRGLTSSELLLGGSVALGVALAAFFLHAPVGPIADPPQEPDGLTAPWFLRALQALLAYFDPWVAFLLFPTLTVVGLLALPHLDVARRGNEGFDERRDVINFFLFVWFLLALLPMITISFDERGPAEPLALARPFSELVWAGGPPRRVWLRELPSAAALALYFLVLPRLLPRWRPTRALFGRYVKRMGPRRFYLAMAFMQVWMLVPLKMYARWLLGIGYFVYLPELSFNF